MKKQQKKIKLLFTLLFILSTVVTIYFINDTYALFETDLTNGSQIKTAKWQVLINEKLINNQTEELIIDKITILDNEYALTEENKIAPGCEGYFEIEIDPNETEVSVKYEISFDFSNIKNGLEIVNISETAGNNITKTGENTYSGIITLSEIKQNKKNNIRVNIRWNNNEENNESDSALGTIKNNKLSIPVNITIKQYLGEDIEE